MRKILIIRIIIIFIIIRGKNKGAENND